MSQTRWQVSSRAGGLIRRMPCIGAPHLGRPRGATSLTICMSRARADSLFALPQNVRRILCPDECHLASVLGFVQLGCIVIRMRICFQMSSR
jgi:hypothetical protein